MDEKENILQSQQPAHQVDKQHPKGLGITAKFILWFLFIALAPLAAATFVGYNSSKKVLEKEVTKSLHAVAENKANLIESYLGKRQESVIELSHHSDMLIIMEAFKQAFEKGGSNSPEYAVADKEYGPFLTYYQKTHEYDNLFLADPSGDIIFAAKARDDLKTVYSISSDSQIAKVFNEAFASSELKISDLEYCPEKKDGAVFIAAPVFLGTEVTGVIIAQTSSKGIYEFAQNYEGLGATGETVVAVKVGNDALFIAPLRSDPNAAFEKKIAIGSQIGIGIQKAVQGKTGSGVIVDYRGKKALSVWKYIPSFRWGIVVKMDTDEVFSSAKDLRNTLFMVSLALLVVVIIMAIIIASSISRPIRELTEISSTIAGGDLTVRAKIKADDEIGELSGAFNQMTDKLLEAKNSVEEQKRMLEKANKELDSFVYTASHDLRAPLRGIASFANFLEEDYKDKLDEEGRDYLKEIREGAGRMNQLIEDLLTLSRISRIKNPYENVNISNLIDSVIKRIQFDIEKNKADLIIQHNIPVVKCDRIKIAEVFLNLINNAIKFSSKNNKENPRVEVGYIPENEFHKFYVRDNGIGIEPKYHDQIFGIFKRLHTAQEYEGTGAGLSIVKRVIDDHGGKIWIDSSFGKGACFYFTIPKKL
ncbi:MAG: ATP-binding protein [Candidatus Omnitrophota bacterium]